MARFREWLPEVNWQPSRVATEFILEDEGRHNVVIRHRQDTTQILDNVQALASRDQRPNPHGIDGTLVARIPDILYMQWKKEWSAGPRAQGVKWGTFRDQRLMERDHSLLRVTTQRL